MPLLPHQLGGGVAEIELPEQARRIGHAVDVAFVFVVHPGPTEDGWSSIVEHGPNETLTISALPNFKIKLGEID
jgi:hypothetical protein